MKTFGLIVPRGIGAKVEANVRALLEDHADPARIILAPLEAWRSLRIQATDLGRQLLSEVQKSQPYQLLMAIPRVGAITRCRLPKLRYRTSLASADRAVLVPRSG